MIGGRVFDTSAIVDFVTGRTRYAEAVVWASVEQQIVVLIPVLALTAALAQIPSRRRDVAEALLSLPVTVVADLTRASAPKIAAALRPVGSGASAVLTAGQVVHCARDRAWPILTADPTPLRALWAEAVIEALP